MRAWLALAGGILVALMALSALTNLLPEELQLLPAILTGLIIFGSGMGSLGIRKHLEKKNRTAEPDSVERELAIRASADAFEYALVIIVVFGACFLIAREFIMALAIYGLVVACITGFWIRYAILRRRVT